MSKRHRHLEAVAEIAMSQLSRWTIAQLFPTAGTGVSLDTLGLPPRGLNMFTRRGYRTVEDIAGLSVEEILDWRNFGAATVSTVLEILADQAIADAMAPEPGTEDENVLRVSATESNAQDSREPVVEASTIDDLRVVAQWLALVGLPDSPLLTQTLPIGTPQSVVRARKRLEVLTSSGVLGAEGAPDAASILDRSIRRLDDRAVGILRDRMFADSPLTLDAIGSKLRVTRERVRQVESKARSALLAELGDADGGPLASLVEAAQRTIHDVLPLAAFLEEIPSLKNTVDTVQQPAWRVLDRLDDSYEIEDGWCASPTVEAARTATATQIEEFVDSYGVAPLASLDFIDIEPEERKRAITAEWLAYCGYLIDGGHVFTRIQSVQDYAASILSVAGSPLSSDDIVARFAVERSVRSLRNALAKDDRFTRVDRDRWGLSEWGLDTYSDIRSLIREELANSGGRVALDPLVEKITSNYSVSPSSVVAYASSAPFGTDDGMVQLASSPREVRKTPYQTRRMFRRPKGWSIRVKVTKDHLRGSGSVAPTAVAAILDLQPGQTLQLDSPLGPQMVAWTGIQPSFGTIRRFLLDRDIAAGADVFLIINDDRTFAVEEAREPIGEPLTDALALIGAAPQSTPSDSYKTLCAAIGIPESSGIASLIGTYRERGDTDISELLLTSRDTLKTAETEPPHLDVGSADVDDILDLL
ncbi:sigma factor-like helix-turn-helix DNA-binding protein [Rhodococcus ruber]|uniref:sigma factor-like helix-turn-helix DNA-binding protein n=2 Tax=Rhodococcus ruber TaxID=1830 RepID=UPI00131F3707|nr:sigma factor-like helix-turn-helix DNA-binding protein [Rhodococcus ruber]